MEIEVEARNVLEKDEQGRWFCGPRSRVGQSVFPSRKTGC